MTLATHGVRLLAIGTIGVLCFGESVSAATRVWDGGGLTSNWSEPANWSGDTVPNLNDLVVFDGTSTKNVIIDAAGPQGANINLGILQIRAGYTGVITAAPAVNVALSVDFNQSEPLSTFVGGSGTIDVEQNFFLSAGTFTAPTGRLFVGANFSHTGGSFLHNGGTVVFDAFSSNIGVPGSETFNNLTFHAINQNKTIIGTLIVLGTLTLTDGSIAAGAIEARADVVHQSGFDGGTTTLRILQPTARTITLAAGGNLPNLVLNAPEVTITTAGTGTIGVANFNLQAGTVEQGDVNFSFAAAASFAQSGGTYKSGTGSFTGVFRFTLSGGTFSHASALLRVNDLFTVTNGTFIGGSGDVDANESVTLSGGTFTAPAGNLFLGHHFTHTAGGSFFHNNGTVIFDNFSFSTIDVSSSETFHNLTFNGHKNLAAGDTLTALGTLTLAGGSVNVGTVFAHGNMLVAAGFGGGSARVTFSGAVAQTYTNNGGANPSGPWTVNKSGGAVMLASHLTLGTGQSLAVASGALDLGPAYNLTAGAITIAAAGNLRNFGGGDLTLGGSLVNNGILEFNGGGAGCGNAAAGDPLLIRSSTSGTARSWSGGGVFSIVDANVQDQNAASVSGGVTALGGVNSGNNANWVFKNCPDPVQITTQPVDQSVCAAAPATFTVGATGESLTFQWRRSGVNLADGDNISGARTATLIIDPAAAGDVGTYDVVVANGFGDTVTSMPASLTLLASPVIISEPVGAVSCAAEPIVLSVAATGDELTYQWRKNGEPLSDGDTISGAGTATLTIAAVAAGDAGVYDVVVSGCCESPAISSPVTLTVHDCSRARLITFEGIPDVVAMAAGTSVPDEARLSTQLQASDGVSFSSTGGYLAVVDLGAHATSQPNGVGGVAAGDLLDYNSEVVITFSRPGSLADPAITDFVSIRGDRLLSGGVAKMEAFDAGGAVIGVATAADAADGLTLRLWVPKIHTIRLTQTESDIAFDDLRFNPLAFRPTANAGADLPTHPGETVVLDGSASSDDNTATGDLIFAWTLVVRPAGSSATLTGADTAQPSFVADVSGEYVAALTVSDADGLTSDADTVVVSSLNTAPVADAGGDISAFAGQAVTLDGSASYDPDSDPLVFSWTLAAPDGSTAVLLNEQSDLASFTPDVPGAYTATLTVTDPLGEFSADSVVVSVISGAQFAADQIARALNTIRELLASQVTTRGNRQALQNYLTQSIAALQTGDVEEALDKLAQAIERVDGCILRGSPDGNGAGRDWITDCSAQTGVYETLAAAIRFLAP